MRYLWVRNRASWYVGSRYWRREGEQSLDCTELTSGAMFSPVGSQWCTLLASCPGTGCTSCVYETFGVHSKSKFQALVYILQPLPYLVWRKVPESDARSVLEELCSASFGNSVLHPLTRTWYGNYFKFCLRVYVVISAGTKYCRCCSSTAAYWTRRVPWEVGGYRVRILASSNFLL